MCPGSPCMQRSYRHWQMMNWLMVVIMLIRMERCPAHGNGLPSLETQGLILFHFSCGLWKGITASKQQQQIPSHQTAASLKQPQERNRVSQEKSWKDSGQAQRRTDGGNGGCKPEFGPASATDGAACISPSVTQYQ